MNSSHYQSSIFDMFKEKKSYQTIIINLAVSTFSYINMGVGDGCRSEEHWVEKER